MLSLYVTKRKCSLLQTCFCNCHTFLTISDHVRMPPKLAVDHRLQRKLQLVQKSCFCLLNSPSLSVTHFLLFTTVCAFLSPWFFCCISFIYLNRLLFHFFSTVFFYFTPSFFFLTLILSQLLAIFLIGPHFLIFVLAFVISSIALTQRHTVTQKFLLPYNITHVHCKNFQINVEFSNQITKF